MSGQQRFSDNVSGIALLIVIVEVDILTGVLVSKSNVLSTYNTGHWNENGSLQRSDMAHMTKNGGHYMLVDASWPHHPFKGPFVLESNVGAQAIFVSFWYHMAGSGRTLVFVFREVPVLRRVWPWLLYIAFSFGAVCLSAFGLV